MSRFVDGLLVQLRDPDKLKQLLKPASDTEHTRLKTLLQFMYDLPKIDSILDDQDNPISVTTVEAQYSLLPPHQTGGVWRQAAPDQLQTDAAYERSDKQEPIWLDIYAVVKLTLVMDADSGQVASIDLVMDVDSGQVASIDTHQLEHVMIQLQQPGPFNPEDSADIQRYTLNLMEKNLMENVGNLEDLEGDSANIQRYTLNLAVFIRDDLDVAATLRSIKLARGIMKRATTYQGQVNGVEVLTPYTPIVIFPPSVLENLTYPRDELQNFFAKEGVMVLFYDSSLNES